MGRLARTHREYAQQIVTRVREARKRAAILWEQSKILQTESEKLIAETDELYRRLMGHGKSNSSSSLDHNGRRHRLH
jgi:hypothetical protein